MARKKYYIGSMGPYLYDDTDDINDAEGDFPGETRCSFRTDGPMRCASEPIDPEDLVRRKDLLDLIHPVNSIYFSVSSDDPGVLLGGTWERVAEGQFLVGLDSTDTDFDTEEETGGAKDHDHGVSGATATTGDAGATTTSSSGSGTTGSSGVSAPSSTEEVDNNADDSVVNVASSTHTHGTHDHSIGSHTHSVGDHNHSVSIADFTSDSASSLPPYFVLSIWKRTA